MSDAKRLAEIRNHSVYHADWWAEKVGPTIEMPLENRSIQFLLSYTDKLEARIAKLRTGLCRLRNEAESYRVECDDGYAYLIDVAESVLTEDDKESAGSESE